MASNFQEDSGNSDDSGSLSFTDSNSDSGSDADSDSGSNADSDSGTKPAHATTRRNICKFYNNGRCRYGDKCRDEHICKHYVEGSCRYGTGCRLNHNPTSHTSPQQNEPQGRRSHGGHQRRRSASSKGSDDDNDDDRPYRWQLNLGKGWEDISHDYILEAQYSCPNTKGIKIYNTSAGAISIDFTKMRVLKKTNIRVRRKGSKQTEWLWYYRSDRGWYKYGEKVSRGKASPIQSSKLESEYQSKPQGSVQFSVASHTYEINFKGMYQENLSSHHKRRVRRRPKYKQSQTGVISQITSTFKNLTAPLNKAPVWQFEGRGGQWYTFQNMGGCSVSSDDIESCYQRKQNTMSFTVKGDRYTLDFSKMTQMNHTTNAKRKVRRV